jgi:chromosome segregation ATPase
MASGEPEGGTVAVEAGRLHSPVSRQQRQLWEFQAKLEQSEIDLREAQSECLELREALLHEREANARLVAAVALSEAGEVSDSWACERCALSIRATVLQLKSKIAHLEGELDQQRAALTSSQAKGRQALTLLQHEHDITAEMLRQQDERRQEVEKQLELSVASLRDKQAAVDELSRTQEELRELCPRFELQKQELRASTEKLREVDAINQELHAMVKDLQRQLDVGRRNQVYGIESNRKEVETLHKSVEANQQALEASERELEASRTALDASHQELEATREALDLCRREVKARAQAEAERRWLLPLSWDVCFDTVKATVGAGPAGEPRTPEPASPTLPDERMAARLAAASAEVDKLEREKRLLLESASVQSQKLTKYRAMVKVMRGQQQRPSAATDRVEELTTELSAANESLGRVQAKLEEQEMINGTLRAEVESHKRETKAHQVHQEAAQGRIQRLEADFETMVGRLAEYRERLRSALTEHIDAVAQWREQREELVKHIQSLREDNERLALELRERPPGHLLLEDGTVSDEPPPRVTTLEQLLESVRESREEISRRFQGERQAFNDLRQMSESLRVSVDALQEERDDLCDKLGRSKELSFSLGKQLRARLMQIASLERAGVVMSATIEAQKERIQELEKPGEDLSERLRCSLDQLSMAKVAVHKVVHTAMSQTKQVGDTSAASLRVMELRLLGADHENALLKAQHNVMVRDHRLLQQRAATLQKQNQLLTTAVEVASAAVRAVPKCDVEFPSLPEASSPPRDDSLSRWKQVAKAAQSRAASMVQLLRGTKAEAEALRAALEAVQMCMTEARVTDMIIFE